MWSDYLIWGRFYFLVTPPKKNNNKKKKTTTTTTTTLNNISFICTCIPGQSLTMKSGKDIHIFSKKIIKFIFCFTNQTQGKTLLQLVNEKSGKMKTWKELPPCIWLPRGVWNIYSYTKKLKITCSPACDMECRFFLCSCYGILTKPSGAETEHQKMLGQLLSEVLRIDLWCLLLFCSDFCFRAIHTLSDRPM